MAAEQRNTTNQQNTQQNSENSDPLYGGKGDQGQQNNQVGPEVYSYHGLHGTEAENEAANTAPDGYGPQDQFGDVDGQDPYTNLDESEEENLEDALHTEETGEGTGETPGGDGLFDVEETLYGLAEPLAKEGDVSTQGTDRDRLGTRGSQDQYGYQK
jgi:hypothetical protein